MKRKKSIETGWRLYIRERNSLNMAMRWQKRGKEFGVEILKFEWNREKGREHSGNGADSREKMQRNAAANRWNIHTFILTESDNSAVYKWTEWGGQRPGAVRKQQNNCRFIKKEGDIFRAWSRWKRKEMTTKAAVEGSGKQIIRYAWELAASRSDGRGRKHAIKEILLWSDCCCGCEQFFQNRQPI